MPPAPEPEAVAVEPPRRSVIGHSVEGRPIEAIVFGGEAGCVLVLGGIHGDEPVSSALVLRLAEHLEAHAADRSGRRVVVIPRANPDGLAAATRWNARGVDLNRNFAAGNFRPAARHGPEPLSEPETRALTAAIARHAPSCVVSVHGPLECVDPDGGAASRRLARRMAAVSPLPVKDLPEMCGSLGSYAGTQLGRTMVTYELERKSAPSNGADGYFGPHLKALLVAVREG
jgi:protein MpaA